MASILGLISGFIKFFDQVVWLIKMLQKTPEEKHQDIVVKIGDQYESFKKGERPKWD